MPCSQNLLLLSISKAGNPVRTVSYYFQECILILSSHQRLGLQNCLFTSNFSTEILHAFVFYPLHATCPARLIFLHYVTLIITLDKQLTLLSFYNATFTFFWYLLPLRAGYVSQHPIFDTQSAYVLYISETKFQIAPTCLSFMPSGHQAIIYHILVHKLALIFPV